MTGSLNIVSLRTGWEAQTYGELPLIYRNISSRHGKSFAFSPTRYFVPMLAYAILQCSAVHFFLQQCLVFVFIKSCLMNSSKYPCKNPHYHNKRGKKPQTTLVLTALISPVFGPHGVFGSTSISHSMPFSSQSPIPESLKEKDVK